MPYVDELTHRISQIMNNKVDKGHDMEAHQVTHLEVCNDNASPVKEKGNVDTVHNDEALKVLTAYDGDPTWVPEQEKKVRMKIDRRLLPILAVTFGLQYYDKTMISQAVGVSISFPNAKINICPRCRPSLVSAKTCN